MQSWISSQAQGLWIALQSSGILQVCTCLPAYLPTCLPAYLPTCLPVPAYLPTCLPAYLPTHLPAYPPTYLPTSRVLGCLGWLPGSCRSCCTSQSFSSPSPSSHHCRLCCVPCLVCKVSHLLFPHVPCRFERVFRLRHPEQVDGGSGSGSKPLPEQSFGGPIG